MSHYSKGMFAKRSVFFRKDCHFTGTWQKSLTWGFQAMESELENRRVDAHLPLFLGLWTWNLRGAEVGEFMQYLKKIRDSWGDAGPGDPGGARVGRLAGSPRAAATGATSSLSTQLVDTR